MTLSILLKGLLAKGFIKHLSEIFMAYGFLYMPMQGWKVTYKYQSIAKG